MVDLAKCTAPKMLLSVLQVNRDAKKRPGPRHDYDEVLGPLRLFSGS